MPRPSNILVFGAFGAAVVLGASACPQSPSSRPGDREMRVELDAYSGQPNPSWDLTPQQAEDLVQRLQALPEERGGGSVRDGLGYRGFIVTGGADLSGFDEMVVSNGVVLGRRAGKTQKLADSGRELEKWLLHTGKGRVANDLYDDIAKDSDPQD